MSNRFAIAIPPPLKAPAEIEQTARFNGLTCQPNARGPQIVTLGTTKVFVQPMDFVDLNDGSRRRAPPLVIGPAQVTHCATDLLARMRPRLTAVTAIDACVGDSNDRDAINKGLIAALVFGVDVSSHGESDFWMWRRCRGDLVEWRRLLFDRSAAIGTRPLPLRISEVAIDST
jgi:hypothetical protein